MDFVVIGGGFAGALLVCQLLAQGRPTSKITWLERRPKFGRGIAYSTPISAHVLNVPAHNMSAFASVPGDFVAYVQATLAAPGGAQTLGFDSAAPPSDALAGTFCPRLGYGAYLEATLAKALAAAPRRVACHAQEVVDLLPPSQAPCGRWELIGADGSRHYGRQVALATGHFAPMLPRAPGVAALPGDLYINDPWQTDAIAQLAPRAEVAVLGAGLSMVDVFLQLTAQGWQGRMTAVSRHGRPIRGHHPDVTPIRLTPPALRTASALVAWLRTRVHEHVARGGDWQQVVDALRPHTNDLWHALSLREQRRLLRHGKSLWDVLRHRVAPAVAAALHKARHAQQLVHHAAQLERAQPGAWPDARPCLDLTWRLRQTGQLTHQRVDALINCTGAHSVWPRANSRLAHALLEAKIVRPGPHGLGLAIAPNGQVLGSDAAATRGLWTLGPSRLGTDFETVAVPELRQQAEALAREMVAAAAEA